ncbi:hypothetical protein DICPUDRAFT_82570 [Dictyostelium purpureum]|uniref:Uncharacterized protein n=1 Tax=Dictyostelium purpureum TaxID=5786 RepID=F0ZWX4_DICPU|nr:uncharacterized protein DICPUDRAFT_82570 [Dictyostelium purpureum]EGC31546.1 hypothetical protein DICPUDRAFT_82570 [Dictyostelium purpureum]|eukprot:XP_003291917.1 hypothetical protein DICPUDRAFT_82570 [Dictyostelium purpureum]
MAELLKVYLRYILMVKLANGGTFSHGEDFDGDSVNYHDDMWTAFNQSYTKDTHTMEISMDLFGVDLKVAKIFSEFSLTHSTTNTMESINNTINKLTEREIELAETDLWGEHSIYTKKQKEELRQSYINLKLSIIDVANIDHHQPNYHQYHQE